MKSKELQEGIREKMTQWQRIEDRAVVATGQVMELTSNSFIRLVMEIIQRDSHMHHRIQGFIAESLSGQMFSLAPEELEKVSALVSKHTAVEQDMLGNVEGLLREVKGKKLLVQEYLLNYLVEDERKHCTMLVAMDEIKKGLYPYA